MFGFSFDLGSSLSFLHPTCRFDSLSFTAALCPHTKTQNPSKTPAGPFQWKRQAMNLYGSTYRCQRRFIWARHPSSWPICGHCSSQAFSPSPLLHWFNYIAAADLLSRGKIYCLRQNSQPISQGVDHCRKGGIRKGTYFNCLPPFPLGNEKENNINPETDVVFSETLGGWCSKSANPDYEPALFTW